MEVPEFFLVNMVIHVLSRTAREEINKMFRFQGEKVLIGTIPAFFYSYNVKIMKALGQNFFIS